MDLINWVYLATGLGVGLGSRWLFPPNVSVPLTNVKTARSPQLAAPTEESNLSATLQQTRLAYLMAQQMSQFKGGFLARTSHELRSPLSNIIGLHQLILSDLCDDRAEERKFIAQAHDAALQLVKLMDEVLNVARIEHGSNKLEIQPLQLSFVLEEVCNILRMVVANRRHKLQLSPPAPEIYVLADPRWLRQIILSLIDAAMFCIEDGGTFELSVRQVVLVVVPESKFIQICIDAPLAISNWNDPIDLMRSSDRSYLESIYTNIGSKEELSASTLNNTPPGLVLLLNQTLLEVMQGKLEILPAPTDSEQSRVTRILISIPQLIPDTALLLTES